jgi:hypothetical protein
MELLSIHIWENCAIKRNVAMKNVHILHQIKQYQQQYILATFYK